MMRKYHGEYRSTTAGLTGCTKTFVTTESDTLLFPPQVEYHCSLCSQTHGFRLVSTHQIATPGQARRFATYCADNSIESDVEVGARRR